MKLLLLFLSMVYATAGLADGDHKHHHGKKEKPAKAEKSAEISTVTLKGELIGLTCFVRHDSKGKEHRNCARECAEKGLPIAVYANNQIYQVSGEGHASLVEAYKPLLSFIEEKVEVEATLFKKQGIRLITINKIKKL